MSVKPPKPNSKEAIEFLAQWSKDGPWLLTAIATDRKAITTLTFGPDNKTNLFEFLKEHNGNRNIYFHVNPTIKNLSKKASREDIIEVVCLHVDIDPRAGEDLEAERKRCLALLTTKLPEGVPPPTVTIFSGGGYQAMWWLEKPIPINGDLKLAEDAKRYNQQLEVLFGADNCHNIDRIMRLPGTINIPDAKKLRKGRVKVLAELVEFNEDYVYPLSRFTPVPLMEEPNFDGGKVIIPNDIRGLTHVDELDQWGVSARVKTIIVQGRLSKKKKGDNSRSGWVYNATYMLLRARVPDDVIFSILTNTDFGISESILEKGDNAAKYAVRQIERAKKAWLGKPPILDYKSPLKSAREFRARFMPTLMHYNGDWLLYRSSAYNFIEDKTIDSELYIFLDKAKQFVSKKKTKPFNPNTAKVGNITHALKGLTHFPRDKYSPPCWLEDNELDPKEILAFKNGLLHLPTEKLIPATSDFFTLNALAFGYDPSAEPPKRWLEFLKELWGENSQEIECLQEVFGYLMVPDTSQQKIFLLIGPPRSGKGTIARVLTELVGKNNVCAPILNSLSNNFGLQTLLGKQVALISDMRTGYKTDKAALAENLLRISGGDLVSVDRKYKDPWEGYLASRFLIMTNELPEFSDQSGALASRFILLTMTESFLGRENPNLINELLPELPGILNWAIEGWHRLKARKHFLISKATQETIQEIADLASPVGAFIRDLCIADPKAETSKVVIYEAYRSWCDQGGIRPVTAPIFSKNIKANLGKVVEVSKSIIAGQRVPVYVGIKLKPKIKHEIDDPF